MVTVAAVVAQRGRTVGSTPPPVPTATTATTEPTTANLTLADRRVIVALQLAVDRLLADRWYESGSRSANDPAAEGDRLLLGTLFASRSAAVRSAAVRALGRFLNPYDALTFLGLLMNRNESPDVRREAEFALVRVLGYTEDPTKLKDARDQLVRMLAALTNHVDDQLARKVVEGQAPQTPFLTSLPAIYESLRRLEGLTESQAADLETVFVEAIERRWPYHPLDDWLPAAAASLAGLERLLDYFPTRPIDDRTRRVLLRVGRFNLTNELSVPNLTAVRALTNVRIMDHPLAEYLVNYTCGEPKLCWEVRRHGPMLTDVRDPESDDIVDRALRDVSPLVRLEMYRRLAAAVKEIKTCARALKAFEDDSPVIRMEAIDMMSPDCKERESIAERFKVMATEFGDPPDLPLVPFAARALIALVQFAPELIPEITKKVRASDDGWFGIWQYRAAVARVAGLTRDEPLALRFIDDPHSNVQYEALNALAIMQSLERWPQALKALESDDYRLVYFAATLLKGGKDREASMHAVVLTLARITKEGKDTSRPVRVELLARLKEIAAPDERGARPLYFYDRDLEVYLSDSDPLVAKAAADMYDILHGRRPTPTPRRLPLSQPTENQLINLPQCAIVDFGLGTDVTIDLFVDEAPLTVAQFNRLARIGYTTSRRSIGSSRSISSRLAARVPTNTWGTGDIFVTRSACVGILTAPSACGRRVRTPAMRRSSSICRRPRCGTTSSPCSGESPRAIGEGSWQAAWKSSRT